MYNILRTTYTHKQVPSLTTICIRNRRRYRPRTVHMRKIPMAQFLKHRKNVPQHCIEPMTKSSVNKISVPILSELEITDSQKTTEDEESYEESQSLSINKDFLLELQAEKIFAQIPETAARFFQQYFLSKFNQCQNSIELEEVLLQLQSKLRLNFDESIEAVINSSESMPTNSNLVEFERNILQLGYHSCIARIGNAFENNVNGQLIDIKSMKQYFDQMKNLDLLTFETFYWMLDGYINDAQIYLENEINEKEEEILIKSDDDSSVIANENTFHSIGDALNIENIFNNDSLLIKMEDTKMIAKRETIKTTFNEFEQFMDETDVHRPSIVIAESPYHRSYIGEQNMKYKDIYSLYIKYLCNSQMKEDIIIAIDKFYYALDRNITPDFDTQLLLMKRISDYSENTNEVKTIFKLLHSYTINSPDISFYNQYLDIIAQFGDIDEAMSCLRLLCFQRNYVVTTPDAPLPNLVTFEKMFCCLKKAVQRPISPLSQDYGARKAEWILKQMKNLKIGAPASLYQTIFESIGVAFWEKLPWHLRLLHRP